MMSHDDPAPLCQRWRHGQHTWRRAGAGGFDRSRYRVEAIAEHQAKTFTLAHHYLGNYPAAIHRFGMIERARDELMGVAVLSAPASARVLTNPFPTLQPYRESVELARFVLLDEVPANGESWFLARTFEQLRERGVRGVVSFADPVPRWMSTGQMVMPGHAGIIYQASNALYAGRSTPRSLVVFPDGSTISARALQKVRAEEQGHRYVQQRLIAAGARPPGRDQDPTSWLARALEEADVRRIRHQGMHRYLFRLGSRRERSAIELGLPTHAGYPKQVDSTDSALDGWTRRP